MKNIFFFCTSFLIICALCAFHCWLAWDTFFWNCDTASMVLLDMSGWHPPIIPWILKGIYAFSGVHIYPLLLLQIIPFYLALFIIVWAVYYRWHTVWALALVLLFFTRQFYLMTVFLQTTSFSGVWVLLLYSLVFYIVLNPFKTKWTKGIFYTLTAIVFFIAINSRHNAIIPVWPLTLVGIGAYLNKKDLNFWSYIWRFLGFSFLSGLACIFLIFVSNAALIRIDEGKTHPATPTFLHHITGACIPEMDKSCFDESWFIPKWQVKEDKWERLKKKYENNKLQADALSAVWMKGTPFTCQAELKGLHKKWLYAIFKHPYNFAVHIGGFYRTMWFSGWKNYKLLAKSTPLTKEGFEKLPNFTHQISQREKEERHDLMLRLNMREFATKPDKQKEQIGWFLDEKIFSIDTIYFVVLNFILFIIGAVLWLKDRKNNIKLLLMAFSFGGVLSNILIPFFLPAIWIRHMHPVFVCGTVALCVFIPFVISSVAQLDFWKKKGKKSKQKTKKSKK